MRLVVACILRQHTICNRWTPLFPCFSSTSKCFSSKHCRALHHCVGAGVSLRKQQGQNCRHQVLLCEHGLTKEKNTGGCPTETHGTHWFNILIYLQNKTAIFQIDLHLIKFLVLLSIMPISQQKTIFILTIRQKIKPGQETCDQKTVYFYPKGCGGRIMNKNMTKE